MDDSTDVPDTVINPVALPVWYISQSTKWKSERDVNLYYVQRLILPPSYLLLFQVFQPVYYFQLTVGNWMVIDSTRKNIWVLQKPLVPSKPPIVSHHHCAFTEWSNIPLCCLAQVFFDLHTLQLRWGEVRSSDVYGSSCPKFEFH